MSGLKKTECMVLECIGLPNKTGVRVWCAYEIMSKYVQYNDMTNYLLTPGVCHSAVCSIEVEGACLALRTFLFRAAEVTCMKLYKIN